MGLIEYQHIQKRFGDQVIYTDLNLTIEEGETLTILGGSGTGKSVMLRMLIGLLRPDSGVITYNQQPLTGLSESKFIPIRKQIAMLFQGGALFDSLTVAENIAYPLRMHFKMKKSEIQSIIAQNLERVGLPGIESKMPSELSGGMQKRVGLARALATNPRVMLYDEPTTGLDPINVTLINELIKKLQRELKITSIVVTHDMDSAYKVSDRLAMLWDQKIIYQGTVDEIQHSKNKTVQRFIKGIA